MTKRAQTLERIIEVAEGDALVRAVYMDGSRTDPTVAPDPYQDWDVVYVVTDTAPYVQDPTWIRLFGETAMVQEPDKVDFGWGPPESLRDGYAWLFITENGVRIDLSLQSVEIAPGRFAESRLRRVVLDKDGLLPAAEHPTNAEFWSVAPGEGVYMACCNEFWWCLNNVGKAVMRGQLPAAIDHMRSPVGDMLLRMLGWYAGSLHDWQVAPGKGGKFLGDLLPPKDYALLLATYPHADAEDIWRAIDAQTTLFRHAGTALATELGYTYPHNWDDAITAYLQALQQGEVPGEMSLPRLPEQGSTAND